MRSLFITHAVAGVAIDRERASLHPCWRRRLTRSDGLANDADRIDARVDDLAAILRRVAAVDALAREIYEGGRSVELRGPRPQGLAIPLQFATVRRRRPRRARQDYYIDPLSGQVFGEGLT